MRNRLSHMRGILWVWLNFLCASHHRFSSTDVGVSTHTELWQFYRENRRLPYNGVILCQESPLYYNIHPIDYPFFCGAFTRLPHHLQMCGSHAHGSLVDAIRRGGCGIQFSCAFYVTCLSWGVKFDVNTNNKISWPNVIPISLLSYLLECVCAVCCQGTLCSRLVRIISGQTARRRVGSSVQRRGERRWRLCTESWRMLVSKIKSLSIDWIQWIPLLFLLIVLYCMKNTCC